MEKLSGQIAGERAGIINPYVEQRIITEDHGVHSKGDIITVMQWGTFGCYDTDGNWVDFYLSKAVK